MLEYTILIIVNLYFFNLVVIVRFLMFYLVLIENIVYNIICIFAGIDLTSDDDDAEHNT